MIVCAFNWLIAHGGLFGTDAAHACAGVPASHLKSNEQQHGCCWVRTVIKHVVVEHCKLHRQGQQQHIND